ncbi:hypothetical protein [Glycomyces harbinensis]|uniref:Secreted protein n=1 Tax=Glycomyces harbinensis TaxID=58114 RepID=A0A1G6ZNJ5_9ACTN|nr:hypothetical protein [Glycomyces harbinensis]SDE04072.1 hypothetical protein SAMN05216270_111108 [Glycomyces harbinensis]
MVNTVLSLMFVAFAVLGAGAPASASSAAPTDEVGVTAWPTGCRYEIQPSQWRATGATCSSANGGSYRALANCKERETGRVLVAFGDWRQTGWSFAYCPGAYVPIAAGIETSATRK